MKGRLAKIDEDKLPIYEIVVDDNDETGISLISLVDEPAIAIKGMAFNQNTMMSFKEIDDKQVIVGPALIPDIKILREDEKYGRYYVKFSTETIERMVEKFNKYGSNRKINIDHSNKMVDAFIMEDWIVEDEVYDKSRKYGFEVPKGTYMIKVKIEDKDFWLEEVKGNGKFGFSIEGILGQQLIKLSNFADRIDIDIYGYKPLYFHICPGAVTTFQHLVDMKLDEETQGMVRSAAQIADNVFRIEADVLKGEVSNLQQLDEAIILVEDFKDLIEEIDEITDMKHNIDYMDGHIEVIKKYLPKVSIDDLEMDDLLKIFNLR